MIAGSKANIDYLKSLLFYQTIGFDKVNQLRHVKYLKDKENVKAIMARHAGILKDKFEAVYEGLESEVVPAEIGSYNRANGGYFVSFYSLDGCAKRIVELCSNAGVVLTPAGAAYPYGNNPADNHIRIAPTSPTVEELAQAVSLFCLCVKIASVEKLLG